MKKTFRTALALGLAAAATLGTTAAQAAPIAGWYGQFVWEESLGRVGGSTPEEGFAAFVTYTLTLGPPVRGTGCTVRVEGFQTNKMLSCTATPEATSLIVKSYDPRGTSRYPMSARLFTLTRGAGGLTTRMEALSPVSDASPTAGPLFRRVR